VRAHNLTGVAGAHVADLLFQIFGLTAFGLPVLVWALAWKWIRSRPIEAAWVRVGGSTLLVLSLSTGACLITSWRPWHGAFSSGGVIGTLLADSLITSLNPLGTALVTGVCLILSLYLLSTFSMTALRGWLSGPRAVLHGIGRIWSGWRVRRRAKAAERARLRQEKEKARKEAQKEERRRARQAPAEVASAAADFAAMGNGVCPRGRAR